MKILDLVKSVVQWLMKAWKEVIVQCRAVLGLEGGGND